MAKIPSTDKLIETVRQAEEYYKPLMDAMAIKRTFADLEYEITIPESISAHKSITPRTKVDKAAEQMITDIPVFRVDLPSRQTIRSEREGDILRKFARYLFAQAERQNDMPPMKECAINLCIYGAACLEALWLADKHDNDEWPILIRALNPETVYPPLRDGSVIKHFSRKVIDVGETVELWNEGRKGAKVVEWDKGSMGLSDDVEWWEYWHRDYKAIFIGSLVGGNRLQPFYTREIVPNPWGVVPQDYRFSGWGSASKSGGPEAKARGVNDFLFDAYQVESTVKSMRIAGVIKDVIGEKVIKKDAFERNEIERPTDFGQPWIVESMDDIKNLEHTHVNPDSYSISGELKSEIDDQTFHGGIHGQAQGRSGVHDLGLIGQELKMWRPPRKQLELMIEGIIERCFTYTQKYGPVRLSGKDRIRPEDIHLPVNSHVSLEPVDPDKQISTLLATAELAVKGLWSWSFWTENAGVVEDITGERKMRWVDWIFQDPGVRQTVAQAALDNWMLQTRAEGLREEAEKREGVGESLATRESYLQGLPEDTLGQIGGFGGIPNRPELAAAGPYPMEGAE